MNEHHADRFPIVAVAENGLEMGRWLATLAYVREKEKESARAINAIKNISPSAGERTNERTPLWRAVPHLRALPPSRCRVKLVSRFSSLAFFCIFPQEIRVR